MLYHFSKPNKEADMNVGNSTSIVASPPLGFPEVELPAGQGNTITYIAIGIFSIGAIVYGLYRLKKWRAKPASSSTTKRVENAASFKKSDGVFIPMEELDQNRKIPYSSKEVMDIAKSRFKNHKDAYSILDDLEGKLRRCNYQNFVDEKESPLLYEERDVYIRLKNHKAETNPEILNEILNHQALLDFIDQLPGIDTTPYRKVDINEGEPLTLEEIKARADQKFADDKNKEEILEKITKRLSSCNYERSLQRGTPPYLNSDGYTSSYSGGRMPDEIDIDNAVIRFLRALPGIDKAPYIGSRLK